jgi:hypothetical protein
MPKVRSPYDEPVIVPWLDHRIVDPGQEVVVTPEQVPGFLAAGWTTVDTDNRKAASAAKEG